MPKLIRENTSIVVIKKFRTIQDFDRVMKEFTLDKSKEELRKIYTYITNHGYSNGFLIDMATRDPNLIYRMDFTPISEIPELC